MKTSKQSYFIPVVVFGSVVVIVVVVVVVVVEVVVVVAVVVVVVVDVVVAVIEVHVVYPFLIWKNIISNMSSLEVYLKSKCYG